MVGLVCAAVLAGAAVPVCALEPTYAISDFGLDSWTDEDGLPHNSVTAFHRGEDGYLWIGTRRGVARFDGVDFTHLHRRTPGMDGDFVTDLLRTSDGTLWASLNETGVTRLDPAPIQTFRVEDGISDDLVTALLERRNGEFWLGTMTGMSRWHGGKAITVASGRLDGTQIKDLAETKDGAVWAATTTGLYRWWNGELTRFTPDDGLPSYSISTLLARPDGLWVGTPAGLARIDGEGIETWGREEGLGNAQVSALAADEAGAIWIGTQQGLHRMVEGTIEKAEGELGVRAVNALYDDGEGGLWVGCRNGLYRLFDVPFTSIGRAQGLPHEFIYTLSEGREGLWVGTSVGTVSQMRKDGRVVTYGPESGLPERAIRVVHEDRAGRVWACTRSHTLHRLDGETWTRVTDKLDCRLALELSTGETLFAGIGEALMASPDGTLRALPGDLPQTLVWGAIERPNGDIWFASKGSGILVRKKTGRIRPLETAGVLGDAHVMSLFEDSEGVVWAGTYGDGLVWVTPEGTTHSVNHRNGLPQTSVFQVLADELGNLWMGTNRGVLKLDRAEVLEAGRSGSAVSTRLFGPRSGLSNRECNGGNQPSALRLRDGRLAFPTIEGIAVVNPSNLRRPPALPTVHVESVREDGVLVPVTDGAALSPEAGRVQIKFTATCLSHPERIRFRYILEGFDEAWVAAGEDRTAVYTQLPAGVYTFRVVATNADGAWEAESTPVTIRRAPQLHERPLGWTVLGLLALALAFGLYRLRLGQLNRRREELENLIAVRTAELEQANRRLERLTVVDDLTRIANLRGFRQRLEQELARAQRSEGQLGIVLCDIDWFKPYNDTYGHVAGNDCLRLVAGALEEQVRADVDLVARYGGEEFAAILVEADLEGATLAGGRFRAAVRALNVPHRGSPEGVVTLSVGVTISDGHEGVDALIARADAALYLAKENGRDRVEAAPALQ